MTRCFRQVEWLFQAEGVTGFFRLGELLAVSGSVS